MGLSVSAEPHAAIVPPNKPPSFSDFEKVNAVGAVVVASFQYIAALWFCAALPILEVS